MCNSISCRISTPRLVAEAGGDGFDIKKSCFIGLLNKNLSSVVARIFQVRPLVYILYRQLAYNCYSTGL